MLPCIVNLLERFRQDWTAHLKPEAILDACRQAGYTWRERTLDPVTTIQLFLLQVLHGNTARAHLPHRSGLAFSETAYCKARTRLPLEVFHRLDHGIYAYAHGSRFEGCSTTELCARLHCVR